ncbi:MAG: phosphopyruvate hydratase [Bdellovibrionaceae bacterium]|nr:phosphopyruvate hydratase [Pseudobdellovibrionaceae bacterium]
MKIQKVVARQILDSRGNPTVEVDMFTDKTWARAAVPSGASTGAHEAHELRDGGSKYMGKGVLKAVLNAAQLGSALEGQSFATIGDFDQWLIEQDGTENKSNLGANALLGLSLAFIKAQALEAKTELFEFLNPNQDKYALPVPLMNIINGGAHANNGVDIQEFMVAPVCGGSFSESLRVGSEIFHHLKKKIDQQGMSTAVGDEGGFAPNLKNNEQALEFILSAIEAAGYKAGEDVFLALDVASTEFFKNGKYQFEGRSLSSEELAETYASWCKKYPIASIEDGMAEDDWSGWTYLTGQLGSKVQLVGDDLFVTNIKRIQEGLKQKAANALLVKVNQIGTVSETMRAISLCHESNYRTVMSHRSGETEDATIADLAVGLGSTQIKTGSPCRGERTAKYNQLLRIEQQLGAKATYWGKKAWAQFCI